MAKKRSFKNHLLDFIYFKILHQKENQKNVRRVYFGLASRIILLLGVLLSLIVCITGIIFFFYQRHALFNEKNVKASILTGILSEQAEYYLDKDISTSASERRSKYNFIADNCESFKRFNNDIVKIILVNEKGIIEYSSYKPDISHKTNGSYLWNCLKEKKLQLYDFKDGKSRYRAVAYPVMLSNGVLIDVLNDYENYYEKYHSSKIPEKKRIYNLLWKKYNTILDKSLTPEYKSETVIMTNDIDLLFHKLFVHLLSERMKKARPKEEYLWNTRWLVNEKQKILNAYSNNLPDIAVKSMDLIKSRITYMKEQIEEIRLLGSLAILFNLDMISSEINKSSKTFIIISLLIFFSSLIAFYFVVKHLFKNISFLEEGAIRFGLGELDNRICITANDETGRLSDILNNMARDIKEKFVMEKFISKSAHSMIKQSNSRGEDITPGAVKRVELSFIFADVRGFTAFSETHTPEEVIQTLNSYFDLQHQIVQKYHGDIDDYVGDQIMAHFGGAGHKLRACKAALTIKKSVESLNKKRKTQKLSTFDIGIGVHSGVVVVGNIGADLRMDFACVGDAVNTTSRLCGKAAAGEILVSEVHVEKISAKLQLSNPIFIEAKGKKEKIKAFILLG